MTSPYQSAVTSSFGLSGSVNIDALLNTTHLKWGGALGSGSGLSFSFPWSNGNQATWDTNYGEEVTVASHFGFNSLQMAAARNALQSWGNVANLAFTEVAESSADVGDFRFAFSSAVGSGVWGYSWYPDSHDPHAADVWINSEYGNDADWAASSYNYEALIHEIGHGLGLKHPGNYNAGGGGTEGPYLPSNLDVRNYTIMSYFDPANDWYQDGRTGQLVHVCPESPMVYDILAIQYLYGANNSYRTGNDLYTFDPGSPFYKTLWDAGGTDTISVGNFSLGCTINLNPGSYSTIAFPASLAGYFDGTNDLGIALGAVIENATGGSGNDVLTGNSANNVLDGGAGADVLSGGEGDDTYLIDNVNDLIYEYASAGYDEVQTTLSSYALSSDVEVLQYLGPQTVAFAGTGNELDNRILGGSGQDILAGLAGNDQFRGYAGNDIISGGSGIDTVIYPGASLDYTVTLTIDGYTVADITGAEGTDTLRSIERLQFSDGTTVLANAYNHAPVLASPLIDQTLSKNMAFVYQVPAATFVDEDADDALSYGVSRVDAGGALVGAGELPAWLAFNAATGTFSGMPANEDVGSLHVRVAATDAKGASAYDTLVFTVTNKVPEVAAVLPDQSSREFAGYSYLIPANTFIDMDGGDILSYSAQLASGSALPGWLHFDVATLMLSGISGHEDVGGLDIEITATDSAGGVASDTFRLVILPAGTSGNDKMPATDGDDIIEGMGGNDTISGGAGSDTASYEHAPAAVTVDLKKGRASGGDGKDALKSIENIIGSEFSDQLIGDAGDNVIAGAGGHDIIDGKEGNNTLDGGEGNNTIIAGAGIDTIVAGAGNDKIAAGSGNNTINAGDGNNVITAGNGDDTITTGSGSDTITAWNGNNTVNAGAGNDIIRCGIGDDSIAGGAGNDILAGGSGRDVLSGGDGADFFVFDSRPAIDNIDTITDFVSGTDKIVLGNRIFSKLKADADLSDNFENISTNGKAADANNFLLYDSSTGRLYYDADGSKAKAAVLVGIFDNGAGDYPILTATDFIVG